jgi:hypothetical protein
MYYPLVAESNKDQNGQKGVSLLKRTYKYGVRTSVEGTVRFKDIPRRDVRIEVKINKDDIIGSEITTSFQATSDADGNYVIRDMPPLKAGATLSFVITDKTIRPNPWVLTQQISDNMVTKKDVNLVNPTYTVTGRLVDQDNRPVGNALVTVDSSSETTKTTDQGFYMVKVYGNDLRRIRFIVDGYDSRTIDVKAPPLVNSTTDDPLIASDWLEKINNTKQILKNPDLFPDGEATADLLGIGTGSLTSRYNTYIKPTETLKGVIDADDTKFTLRKGSLTLTAKLNGKLVRAALKFSNDYVDTTIAGAAYKTPLVAGKYSIEISSIKGETPFVPFSGEFDIVANNDLPLTVLLEAGITVSGKVLSKETNEPIDSVAIDITGTSFKTYTDTSGSYSMTIPSEQEYQFNLRADKYNSTDTSFYTQKSTEANYVLETRDTTLLDIKTISGFPVTIDKQVKAGTDNYIVSGKLTLTNNDIFSVEKDAEELTFKNISVKKSGDQGAVVPEAEIVFEEAVLNTKAFGFVPVEVEGFPQIRMKGVEDRFTKKIVYERGIIGGTEMTAKFSTITKTSSIPIRLVDAVIKSKDSTQRREDSLREIKGLAPFAYVYTPPAGKIVALRRDQEFSLEFAEADVNVNKTIIKKDTFVVDTNYQRIPFGLISYLYIKKKDALLDKSGLSLAGYLQINKLIGAKLADSGRVEIKKFTINQSYDISELTLLVSKTKPKILKLQKVEAQLTSISLYGVGTPNFGIGFGGTVKLKRGAATATQREDTLTINSLSIINKPEGLTLSASLSLDSNGFSIKGLVFTTPNKGNISVTYNTSANTFIFETSGVLKYNPQRSSTAPTSNGGGDSFIKSAFPIEIQAFKFSVGSKSQY